jgi:hypothetical protein
VYSLVLKDKETLKSAPCGTDKAVESRLSIPNPSQGSINVTPQHLFGNITLLGSEKAGNGLLLGNLVLPLHTITAPTGGTICL